MRPNFSVISDPAEKIMGGIENHANILIRLLSNHGYDVTPIDYHKLFSKKTEDFDVVIIEGIHRLQRV